MVADIVLVPPLTNMAPSWGYSPFSADRGRPDRGKPPHP